MTLHSRPDGPGPALAAAHATVGARPEGTLVALAQGGDGAAREELARRARRPAYLLALQLTGDPEESRDVTQDALLRFFATLDSFDAARPVKPWLARIVRNRVFDGSRRRRARPAVSLDALCDDGFEPALPSGVAGPEELARRSELQRRIWRALATLSAAHREILVLRDYQDLSYAEIATALGIPAGTVMSRLHAARRALRDALAAPAPGGAHHA